MGNLFKAITVAAYVLLAAVVVGLIVLLTVVTRGWALVAIIVCGSLALVIVDLERASYGEGLYYWLTEGRHEDGHED